MLRFMGSQNICALLFFNSACTIPTHGFLTPAVLPSIGHTLKVQLKFAFPLSSLLKTAIVLSLNCLFHSKL